MKNKHIVSALAALAQETRLSIFKLLVQAGSNGLPAGRLSELLNIAPSSLSFHLKEMTHANMVTSQQSGRYVIYSANYHSMDALIAYLTDNCCAGTDCLPNQCLPQTTQSFKTTPIEQGSFKETPMSDLNATHRNFNVLILCTNNSARSIMAEAIFNNLHEKHFNAYSAGSDPSGKVNPFALDVIQSVGYPTDGIRSKSWDEFSQPDAPHMDFVFTVCDKAAGQACPIWPGHPISAHWGFADPAAFEGTDEEKHAQFLKIFHQIRNRIQLFAALPLSTLDRTALQHHVNQIGQTANIEQ